VIYDIEDADSHLDHLAAPVMEGMAVVTA